MSTRSKPLFNENCWCSSWLLPVIKVPMTRNFYYLVRKSFQNDEEWRLFCFDRTLGCRVIQDFDLCKLDMCDVTNGTQSGAKSQKIEYLCKYAIYRVEILQG